MENQKYKNLKPSLLIVGGAGFIGYHLAAKSKKKGLESYKFIPRCYKKSDRLI